MAIKLRGHHLRSLHWFSSLDRESYIQALIEREYVPSRDHPFVQRSRIFMEYLLRRDDLKVALAGVKRDKICCICPIYSKCPDFQPEGFLLRNAHPNSPALNSDYDEDADVAKRYGLELGKTYTMAHIKDRLSKTPPCNFLKKLKILRDKITLNN